MFHVEHSINDYYLGGMVMKTISNFLPDANDWKKIQQYILSIKQWEKKTDLVGKNDLNCLYERHIINCLNLLYLFKDEEEIIFDIGTGAGLPGLVCAMIDKNKKRKYYLFEKKIQKI